jgi:hypothetical protein
MPAIFAPVTRIDRFLPMVLTGLLACCLSSEAFAQKGPAGPPASPESNPEKFLAELGGDLKMAVRVQAMTGEDAKAVWDAVSNLVGEDKETNDEDAKENTGGHLWYAMRVPEGGDFRTLLRPEFIRRDIDLIVNRLELDDATAPIAESVLLDYEDAFETEASRFRELLDLGASQVEIARLEPIFEAADASNQRALESRIADGMVERGVSDEKVRGTLDWIDSRMAGMRTRIAMLEPMLERRRAAIERAGGGVAARSVIEAMNRMDQRRRELRTATVESIATLVDPAMESSFNDLLDEIRIQHGMADSRMGGATTDIVAALESIQAAPYEAAGLEADEAELLREIAIRIDARTEARIRREKQALELSIEMIESGGDGDSRVRSRVRNAATAELTAELAVRDAILGRVDLIRTRLEDIDAESAAAFLNVARRTGFRAQMRSRWCEEATEFALKLEGLDAERLASLAEIDAGVRSQIAFLRTTAIQRRLDNETRVARAMVEAVMDDGVEAKSLGEQAWREPGYEGFDRLDDQIEAQLLAALGPDWFEELPRRPGRDRDDAGKDGGKPDGKNGGKGGGKNGGKGGGTSGKGGRSAGGAKNG